MRGKISLSPLKIADTKLFNETKALDVQGTYPVIYIDFKNCKAGDYESIKKLVRTELSESFNQHVYLQDSPKLSVRQRKLVEQ